MTQLEPIHDVTKVEGITFDTLLEVSHRDFMSRIENDVTTTLSLIRSGTKGTQYYTTMLVVRTLTELLKYSTNTEEGMATFMDVIVGDHIGIPTDYTLEVRSVAAMNVISTILDGIGKDTRKGFTIHPTKPIKIRHNKAIAQLETILTYANQSSHHRALINKAFGIRESIEPREYDVVDLLKYISSISTL